MTWSTRELAELAGTTVKAVRHYHQIGLLDEPERASNGYKHYEITHLVRLLRIKRLVDLGVPLARIALMGQGDEPPDEALRAIDGEIADTIGRLLRTRADLESILHHKAPADLPQGFSEIGTDLPDATRALILIYSHVFGPTAMAEHAEMLAYARQNPQDAEFIALPAETDEASRQQFAVRLAPHVKDLNVRYPWLRDPGAGSVRGSAFAESVIGEALRELYNPAQRDVLRRVNEILYPEAGGSGSSIPIPRSDVIE
jgi:DNA-binding transcriptional MerR regulator